MVSFSKYHGCGNNFIIVKEEDLRAAAGMTQSLQDLPEGQSSQPEQAADEEAFQQLCSRFAKKVCGINTGVGADGLITVRRVPAPEMIFYNQDGSRAPMCGNGIRCFAHYCHEENICREKTYPVKTPAGDMIVEVTDTEPFRVRINMGHPIFSPQAIGVDSEQENFLAQVLTLGGGRTQQVDSLFMGTVHTVVPVEDFEAAEIEKLGEEICNHPTFSEKTNVNFVKLIDDKTLELKTYERGVGMTLACGTGACASVFVTNMQGRCSQRTEVRLPLGSLVIEIAEDGDVYMTGPSEKIADGAFCIDIV